MTIKEAAVLTLRRISTQYESRESANILKILFEDLFSITNLESEKQLEDDELLENAVERLINGEPIQYITGQTNFFGYDFKVNQNVLIPRPETEELVHWVLSDYKKFNKQNDVLDIGLGSGCIALTVKLKKPQFRLFGIEKSLEALNVARINSRRLRTQMTFYAFDFLEESFWPQMGMFDIIVSNPPYIDPDERNILADNVLLYEPEIALFAYDDPLIFYKKIMAFSKLHLKENGSVYLEIHENHAGVVEQIYEQNGFSVEIRKDLQGKDRMLKAWMPES